MESEYIERLTRTEERAKSNTNRLNKLESVVDEIHTMSKTMVELIQEVKHTNEAVSDLDVKVDRIDSRVDEMEKTPAKEMNNVKRNIVNKAIGIIIEFLIAGLVWAAIQAI